MSMENIVGKSLEELARGSQILDTPYDSTTVYELGSLIRDEMRIPINVSITTSNSSGTVLDNGESSIASSIQVSIKSSGVRKFLTGKGITQPDFVAMAGDIINAGMLFSVANVTIDRYNVSSLYDDTLTISIDYAYTKVTDFDGGKDLAKKNETSLNGLVDKVNNLSTLVQTMDKNFGTEVETIKKQLDSSTADTSVTDTTTDATTNNGTTDSTTDTTTDTGTTDETTPSSTDNATTAPTTQGSDTSAS